MRSPYYGVCVGEWAWMRTSLGEAWQLSRHRHPNAAAHIAFAPQIRWKATCRAVKCAMCGWYGGRPRVFGWTKIWCLTRDYVLQSYFVRCMSLVVRAVAQSPWQLGVSTLKRVPLRG